MDYCISVRNFTTNSQCSTSSPHRRITGHTITEQQLLTGIFGTLVVCRKPQGQIKDRDAERGQIGLVIGFEVAYPTIKLIALIPSMEFVTRQEVKPIPLTEEIKSMINSICEPLTRLFSKYEDVREEAPGKLSRSKLNLLKLKRVTV